MLFMTGSKSNGSGGLLREVACPVCTDLQVRNTYKYYLPFVTSLGWLCLLVVPIYRCKFQHLDLRRLNVVYVSTLFSLVLISVALNFTILVIWEKYQIDCYLVHKIETCQFIRNLVRGLENNQQVFVIEIKEQLSRKKTLE